MTSTRLLASRTPSPITGPDGSSVRQGLQESGHMVLRQVLDPSLVRQLQELALVELREAEATDGSMTQAGQPLATGPGTLEATYLPKLAASEILEHLLRADKVWNCISEALRTDEVFLHPNRWVRAMPPQNIPGYSAPNVHQDLPELQGTRRQLTLWMPLYPVTPDTGGLPIYAFPEPRNVLPFELSSSSASGWRIPDQYLDGAPTQYNLAAGDALLFDALVPHGGAVNVGTGWRVSIEARFQPLDEPICENQLLPFTGIPWEEQRSTWGAYRESWLQPRPETIPFDDSWEKWRNIESLTQGSMGNLKARRALEIAEQFAQSEVVRSYAARLLGELSVDNAVRHDEKATTS